MPDGDMVHGLGQNYHLPYRQICDLSMGEEGYGLEEIRANLLKALHESLRNYGDTALELFKLFSDHISHLQLSSGSIIDVPELNGWIEQQARSLSFIKRQERRARSLAIEACKQHVQTISMGPSFANNFPAIVRTYIDCVYKAQFEGRLPTSEHYNNVDNATFWEALHNIQGFIDESLAIIADTSIRLNSFSKFRRSLKHRTPLDHEADLTELFIKEYAHASA